MLLPHVEIVEMGSGQSEQSERWKYLKPLIDRRAMWWPAGAKLRRSKVYKRFRQEMEDLQLLFKGPYVLAGAPKVKDAHDDYPDCLSMAAILTKDEGVEDEVEVFHNVFYRRGR